MNNMSVFTQHSHGATLDKILTTVRSQKIIYYMYLSLRAPGNSTNNAFWDILQQAPIGRTIPWLEVVKNMTAGKGSSWVDSGYVVISALYVSADR